MGDTVNTAELAAMAAPYNPRKMAPRELEALRASLRAFGVVQPIVVNRNGPRIVGGHQRVQAAMAEGLEALPVVWVDLDPSQERQLNLALNRIAGEWDEAALAGVLEELRAAGASLDLTGFGGREIDRLLRAMAGPPADELDRMLLPPPEPVTKPGELVQLGPHRLMCGDATRQDDVVRLFGGVQPELVLTDPPYCSGGFQESGRAAGSVGRRHRPKQVANDRLSTRGYAALLKAAFSIPQAPYLYAFSDWRMWVHLFDVVESCGFGVRSMIVWDKTHPGMGRGWRSQHELIMWAAKVTPPFDKHGAGGGNVIQAKRTGNDLHTTQKPVDLLTGLLEVAAFAVSVYDPFAGSGSTLVAAAQTGRRSYSMEIDPAYCDVIVNRWQQLTGERAARGAAA